MSYINYNSILTADELKALGALMEQVRQAASRVSLRRTDGQPGDETVDLSMLLRNGVTYPERFALLRRFFDRYSGHDDPIDMLWGLLTSGPVGDSLGRRSNLVNVFEPFCRHLYELMSGEHRPGIVLNDLFELRVRDNKRFFANRDSVLGRFYLKVKDARNSVSHGKPLPKDAGVMVVLAMLILVRKYTPMLTEEFIAADELIELDLSAEPDSERIIEAIENRADELAARLSDEARERLCSKFGLVADAASAGLDTALPRLIPKLIYRPGITVLQGASGTGAATELLRAVAQHKPCQYMIVIGPAYLTRSRFDVEWLAGIMNGDDAATMLPAELELSKNWVRDAAAAGRLCIVIDRPRIPIATKLRNMADSLPGLMILVRLESLDSEVGKQFKVDESNLIRPRPLSEAQQAEVTTLVGRHLVADADLSGLLLQRIGTLRGMADLTSPRTLVAALGELARTLTITRPDYTAISARLSELGGSCEAYERLEAERLALSEMARDVHAAIYGDEGYMGASRIIAAAGVLAVRRRRRRFFELCHLMQPDDKVAMLATVAARMLLDGIEDSTGGQAHNPRLPALALATATLPLDEPAARNAGTIYRPSPRYIAERFVLNRLILAPPTDDTDGLVTAAMLTATPRVIRRLMSSPLFAASNNIYHFDEPGIPPRPSELAVAIVGEIQRRSLTGTLPCVPLYRTYMNLLDVMNDAQRIELCGRLKAALPPRPLCFLPTATAANLAILHMDVPACHELYDMSARLDTLPEKFVADFVSRCSAISQPLLIKVARHAARYDEKRLLRDCLAKLAGTGAYLTAEFAALAAELLDHHDKDIAALMVEQIDMMPLEEIDHDIATRIYNPTLAHLTIGWLAQSPTARTRLRHTTEPTTAMLADVLPNDYCVDGVYMYPYRLYGYKRENCVELGMEYLRDDAIEAILGRTVDITGRGPIGQVTGARRLMPGEHDARYAHLTIELPHPHRLYNAPKRMMLSLGTGLFSKAVPYVAVFQRDDSRIAIVRITDPEAIDALQHNLLNRVVVKINDLSSRVVDVDIVELCQPLTVVEVSACYDLKPGVVPPIGRLSLHFTPEKKSRQYAETLQLHLTPVVSRAADGYLKGAFSAGCNEQGDLMLVLPQSVFIYKASVLRVNGNGPALKIVGQYSQNNRQSMPEGIARWLDTAIAAYTGPGKGPMPSAMALTVRPLEGSVADLPGELTTPGKPVTAKLKRQWPTGLFSPVSPLWSDAGGTRACECAWVPLYAELLKPSGFAVHLPQTPLWSKVAYMRLLGVPFTFATTYNGTHWVFDAMFKTLVRSRSQEGRSNEPFYVMFLDSEHKPLRPRWDDPVALIDMVPDWGHIAPETASMIAEIAADAPAVLDKLRASLAAEAEAEGYNKWLARKLFARSLTPRLCSLLPLQITRRGAGIDSVAWRDTQGKKLLLADTVANKLKPLLTRQL